MSVLDGQDSGSVTCLLVAGASDRASAVTTAFDGASDITVRDVVDPSAFDETTVPSNVDVVVIDPAAVESSISTLLAPIRAANPDLPVIVFVDEPSASAADALAAGATEVIETAPAEMDRQLLVHRVYSVTGRDPPGQSNREIERHHRLFETISDGIYGLDESGRIVDINDGLTRMTGYPREKLLGQPVSMLLDEESQQRMDRDYRSLLDGDRSVATVELTVETADGNSLPVENCFSLFETESDAIATVGVIRDISDRKRRERALERRRAELVSLDRLGRTIQDINRKLIEASSRAEIEAAVPERLADDGPFVLAWIGSVDRGTDLVTADSVGGKCREAIDETLITVGSSDDDLISHVVRTGTMCVVSDIETTDVSWDAEAIEHGCRSVVAVPIAHEESVYGVLVVYADETDAFGPREREMLDHLGDSIGHAIASLERKQALLSDTITELELQLVDVSHPLIDATDEEATIEFVRTIPADGGAMIQYASVTGIAPDAFEAAVERVADTDAVRKIRDESSEETLFEITSSGALMTLTAEYDGRVHSFVVKDDTVRTTIELPVDTDVREFIEAVRDTYPNVELLAQRTVTRQSRTSDHPFETFTDRLTDRQQTVLETAYFSGFFDWPRTTTGEEVGEVLEISPATFSQHIRTAERTLLEAVFERDEDG